MELKQLNKVIIILVLSIGINLFSQLKMADLDNKEISIDLRKQNKNIISILDNMNYSVCYILDKSDFDLKIGSGINERANILFFSKRFKKGIIVNFRQLIYHTKKSVYNITLYTGSVDNYMFIPSMIILDKDFNYEYLMKYHYINLPNDRNVYTSSFTIQDNKNYCNFKNFDLKGNIIYENIDDILGNISKITADKTGKDCTPIIYEIDLKDFFPKKISRQSYK